MNLITSNLVDVTAVMCVCCAITAFVSECHVPYEAFFSLVRWMEALGLNKEKDAESFGTLMHK